MYNLTKLHCMYFHYNTNTNSRLIPLDVVLDDAKLLSSNSLVQLGYLFICNKCASTDALSKKNDFS